MHAVLWLSVTFVYYVETAMTVVAIWNANGDTQAFEWYRFPWPWMTLNAVRNIQWHEASRGLSAELLRHGGYRRLYVILISYIQAIERPGPPKVLYLRQVDCRTGRKLDLELASFSTTLRVSNCIILGYLDILRSPCITRVPKTWWQAPIA